MAQIASLNDLKQLTHLRSIGRSSAYVMQPHETGRIDQYIAAQLIRIADGAT